jgi:hypothetical protein
MSNRVSKESALAILRAQRKERLRAHLAHECVSPVAAQKVMDDDPVHGNKTLLKHRVEVWVDRLSNPRFEY